MAEITSTLDDKPRAVVADALQGQLTDLIDLALTCKQLHWNVVGPQFRPVHLQLDEVVTLARAQADVMAERAAALGINADGRPRTVADATPFDEPAVGWIRDHDVVTTTTGILDRLVGRCRERIAATEEADPATQDLLIAVCQGLEQQRWMWQAQA